MGIFKNIELKELKIKRIYRLNISKETKEFFRKAWVLMYPIKYSKECFVENLRANDIAYICRIGYDLQRDCKDKISTKIKSLAVGKRGELKKIVEYLDKNNYFFNSGEDLIDLT